MAFQDPRLVADILKGPAWSSPLYLSVFDGVLYFLASDGVNTFTWSSGGNSVVKLTDSLSLRILSALPQLPVSIGSTTYFVWNDGKSGTELWQTDGTKTALLADIFPGSADGIGPNGSFPGALTAVGKTLYFSANDGKRGFELWKTDGLVTQIVKDVNFGIESSNPNNLIAIGDTLFFTATNSLGVTKLWKTNGSATSSIADVALFADVGVLGNNIYYSQGSTVGATTLWKTDGTTTAKVAEFEDGYFPRFFTPVGNALYFSGYSKNSGIELWKTDGVTTTIVEDIHPGPNSSLPRGLTAVGDTLYFKATGADSGTQIWKTDGIETTRVTNGNGYIGELKFLKDTLFLSYNDGLVGSELWAIDVKKPQSAPPTLAVKPLLVDQPEGDIDSQVFTFRVTRSGDTSAPVSARWMIKGFGDNPASPADFLNSIFPSGEVKLGINEIRRTIAVRVAGDSDIEADEQFKIILSDPIGATIEPAFATAIATIRNDDNPGTELSIFSANADRAEGFSGNTPYTFKVNRSGDTSKASSARWAVTGSGANPVDSFDFAGNVLPSGPISFAADQKSRTITINVRGDRLQESDESFTVRLFGASGATISTARATGIIRNDDLLGTSAADVIVGTNRAEYIDGRAGSDSHTGGEGNDIFGFRFGESRIAAPDRITDFRFGVDRTDLFAANGAARPAPLTFNRAANNSTATTRAALVAAVFADADGALSGAQSLAANAAALVRSTNSAIAGTYLLINDADAALNPVSDLLINITGFRGTLPALGAIAVNTVFV